jgi:hypothetical protein
MFVHSELHVVTSNQDSPLGGHAELIIAALPLSARRAALRMSGRRIAEEYRGHRK